jgi:hypothetical protein
MAIIALTAPRGNGGHQVEPRHAAGRGHAPLVPSQITPEHRCQLDFELMGDFAGEALVSRQHMVKLLVTDAVGDWSHSGQPLPRPRAGVAVPIAISEVEADLAYSRAVPRVEKEVPVDRRELADRGHGLVS